MPGDDPSEEVAGLLGTLIRNACVNDGTAGSGGEARNSDVLESVLAVPGVEVRSYEPTPGRRSLVARIEGTEPAAPVLALLGHTDVVPASPDRWRHDPFGGERVGDEVWGRGAVDMLGMTASMAVAARRLAGAGFRPRGTLVVALVADEEASGAHGAARLVEDHWDDVRCDWLVTEGGGWPHPGIVPPGGAGGPLERTTGVQLAAGEKGWWWGRLVVTGRAGHASQPHGSDNALVTAAEVVRRLHALAPPADVGGLWRRTVAAMGLDPVLAADLVDPGRVDGAMTRLEPATAALAHACTHTTVVPTVVHGGVKANVVPDRVELQVDARLLPGVAVEDVERLLGEVCAGLPVEVEGVGEPAVESPVGTPLHRALEQAARRLRPEVRAVPTLMAGSTDARFFRRRGVVAYGFGLWSGRHGPGELARMFHGDDERVDLATLGLTTRLWEHLARDLLGR